MRSGNYWKIPKNQKRGKPDRQITSGTDRDYVSKPHLRQKTNIGTGHFCGCLVSTAIWGMVNLLLTGQVGCHIVSPVDITNPPASSAIDYHWNCGLNVGYVTLRLFHKDVDIAKLAEQIKAGARLERNVSLLDLKRAFEKYGLIAEGFKADYPEEIIEFAQPDSVLIVRVDSQIGDQSIGHFIVIKGDRDHVIVIDPPYHPKKFTRQSIIEDGVLSRTSGEFLIVY